MRTRRTIPRQKARRTHASPVPAANGRDAKITGGLPRITAKIRKIVRGANIVTSAIIPGHAITGTTGRNGSAVRGVTAGSVTSERRQPGR
jgi:hypothetical protein